MRNQLSRGGARVTIRLLAAIVGLSLLAPRLVQASTKEEQRARIGLQLFKSLLAADLGIEERAQNDELAVVFLYARGEGSALELAEIFGAKEAEGTAAGPSVRGIPLRIVVSEDRTLTGNRDRPAAIFLTEPMSDAALERLVRYGIDHRVLVYSPFEGDVEKGVAAGLYIGAQVRPYVNLATLKASGIRLKSFFLRAARTYPTSEAGE